MLMEHEVNTIKKSVMRRVYYIFTLRAVKHPLFSHGVVMGASFFLLSQAVSIPNIWVNMLEVKVGDLAQFWIGAFLNTGALTLVLLTLLLVAALSLPWRWKTYEFKDWAY